MPTREDLILRDKRLMTRSMIFAEESVSSVVPDLSELSSSEAGGAVRTIATGTVEQFGQLATVTAADSYQALRDVGMNDALANLIASRGRADAYLVEPIAVAATTRVDSVVGQTMKKFSQGRFVEAQSFLGQAIARVVGNIYRETQVTNSERDPMATGYQRVASAGACSFCLTVALNTYTTFEQSGGYHTHCSCSSVPIFKGQQAFRPDYYDDFEKLYKQGRIDANSDKAGDIFRAIRRNMITVQQPPVFRSVPFSTLPSAPAKYVSSFQTYTGSSYKTINETLREASDDFDYKATNLRDTAKDAGKLAEALYSQRLTTDVKLYRYSDFFDNLTEDTVKAGTLLNSKGITSTTLFGSRGQSDIIDAQFSDKPVKFEILAPKGTYGSTNIAQPESSDRFEGEFMLAPGTKLLITQVQQSDSQTLVTALVTGQEKPAWLK